MQEQWNHDTKSDRSWKYLGIIPLGNALVLPIVKCWYFNTMPQKILVLSKSGLSYIFLFDRSINWSRSRFTGPKINFKPHSAAPSHTSLYSKVQRCFVSPHMFWFKLRCWTDPRSFILKARISIFCLWNFFGRTSSAGVLVKAFVKTHLAIFRWKHPHFPNTLWCTV